MLTVVAALKDRPLAEVLQRGGVVGAGGAGFPTWAKYTTPQPFLVVNAQESEPGYFIDKWLHKHHSGALHALFEHLRATRVVDKVVVAAKLKDREWIVPLLAHAAEAKELDCTGKNRHNLREQSEPLLLAWTDDRYSYGMETALLLIVAQQKIPTGERPTQHGFIVNNTETLFNIHRLLTTGAAVVDKLVHVYGATPRHTFREVPVGTPASWLLQDAGVSLDDIAARSLVVVDGGPGWFEKVDAGSAVVTRRTNSFLVLDPAVVDVTQKDVFDKPNKPGYPSAQTVFETSPSPLPVAPSWVRLPLIDNPNFKAVSAAVPVVAVGDVVRRGDTVARAADVGVSVAAHASIDGVVAAVTDRYIEVDAATPRAG